jgi:hypothetical protein|tara:strand:+ start:569 stop:787 length:219 start_codon:yes stop_codon:yes gene_type:complete
MKYKSFILKDPEDTKVWLEEAYLRLSGEDLNFLATMAWNLSHMEEFIFSSETRSEDFFDHMKAEAQYQKRLH